MKGIIGDVIGEYVFKRRQFPIWGRGFNELSKILVLRTDALAKN